MLSNEKYLALSLGQLTNSNVWTSIGMFAHLQVQKSYFPRILSYPYYYVRTTLSYFYDVLIGGNIAKHKKGFMHTEPFLRFLGSKLSSSLSPEDLTTGYNAMCSMGEKEKANLSALISFLVKHTDVTAVIASSTNDLHFDHIMEQMRSLADFSNLMSSNRIKFINSFVENELSVKKLAIKPRGLFSAIENDMPIYSLHREIKDLSNNLTKFICDPFNPSKATLKSHLEKAEKFFDIIAR